MPTPKRDPLGIITKSASKNQVQTNLDFYAKTLIDLYYWKSLAAQLLPTFRVCICGCWVRHDSTTIDVVYGLRKRVPRFRGLAYCGSVWTCPVCGNKISEKRKSELKTATQAWTGDVLMASYTLRHNAHQSLHDVLTMLKTAFRDFSSGRFGKDLREKYGIVGTVRALEITHGSSGWHPHIHQLVFCKKIIDSHVKKIEHVIKVRWLECLGRAGGDANYERGVTVVKDADFLADYVAKFGHTPKHDTWSIEHELAKANVKRGRNGGRSPFELLRDYGEGDKRSGLLFQEYAYETFGDSQLVWTRGLKERFNIDIETDEEVLEKEQGDGNFRVLAVLTTKEWSLIRKRELQAFLLISAMRGDAEEVERFLIENNVRGYNGD